MGKAALGDRAIELMLSDEGEEGLAREACRVAVEAAGLGFAAACLLDSEGGLVCVAAAGLGEADRREFEERLSRPGAELGLVGRAMLERRVALCDEVAVQAEFGPLGRLCLERGARSAAVFPLLARRSLVGLLACGAAAKDAFDADRAAGLERLALELALSLELGRARLAEEEARREAGEQAGLYRASFAQSSAVKILIDPALGTIVQANAAAERFYGYPPGVLATLRLVDINAIAPEQVGRNIERVKARMMDRFESRHKLASGEVRDVEVFSGPIRVGARVLLHSIIVDITEKKSIKAEMERLLVQKDTLMKELQHRVKNNLSVVSALLGMEADKTSDEGAREALEGAISRVGAIAAVYERLYASEDLATVGMRIYGEGLARSIFETYNLDPSRVSLASDFDELALDPQRCVPLGLALNELLSNALKYAYPGDRRGEIRVSLRKEGGGAVLAVEDDGPGIPQEFRGPDCDSMGMALLRSFARQLGGSLELDCSAGTRARLRFPL